MEQRADRGTTRNAEWKEEKQRERGSQKLADNSTERSTSHKRATAEREREEIGAA